MSNFDISSQEQVMGKRIQLLKESLCLNFNINNYNVTDFIMLLWKNNEIGHKRTLAVTTPNISVTKIISHTY